MNEDDLWRLIYELCDEGLGRDHSMPNNMVCFRECCLHDDEFLDLLKDLRR